MGHPVSVVAHRSEDNDGQKSKRKRDEEIDVGQFENGSLEVFTRTEHQDASQCRSDQGEHETEGEEHLHRHEERCLHHFSYVFVSVSEGVKEPPTSYEESIPVNVFGDGEAPKALGP